MGPHDLPPLKGKTSLCGTYPPFRLKGVHSDTIVTPTLRWHNIVRFGHKDFSFVSPLRLGVTRGKQNREVIVNEVDNIMPM